jgi:tRNA (guanosine-2'-O-)-methyltransferase
MLALKKRIFEEFAQYLTDERRRKIELNAEWRTRAVTVVLEDVYQAHNISAVLRSAECFGIQDVHIIEGKHRFVVDEAIAKGSAQWLNLATYEGTQSCYASLRSAGYTIVATTPHENDMLIEELPINRKTALIFGTEQYGLSPYALENADAFVKVPLYGFTESFNVSVCAGIVLYEFTKRLRASDIPWRLSEEEMLDLQLAWLGASTYRTKQIEERLKVF